MFYITIFLLVTIVGLIIWLISINGSYYFTRSICLDVSREKTFELILDFNTWTSWSPWLCIDPDAIVSITKGRTNIGSVYKWTGTLVGTGEIELKSFKQDISLEQEIRFSKPFKSKSDVFWRLSGKGETCQLTWGMKGKMPFFLKFLAKSIEPMVGSDYERGLKMIKDKLENGTIASFIKIEGICKTDSYYFLGLKIQCSPNEFNIEKDEILQKLNSFTEHRNLFVDKVIILYHNHQKDSVSKEYSIGINSSISLEPTNSFHSFKIPSFKAIKVTFNGDAKHLENAWAAANTYAQRKKLKIVKSTDPITISSINTQTHRNTTEIYLPIK
nr:SRPBCC family protein [uncultured Carboxylicivirga sp.]